MIACVMKSSMGYFNMLTLLILLYAIIACHSFSLATLKSSSESVSKRSNRGDKLVQQSEGREYCQGCNRPPIQCLCDYIPNEKIALDTKVLVLQHPVEFRRKTVSTVPLLKLTLDLCQVLVGRSFGDQIRPIIDDACAKGRIPIVLFPGPDAICLEDDNVIAQLEQGKIGKEILVSASYESRNSKSAKYLLVIVDGTWTQAKRMLRNSPILLERCQKIQFTGTSDRSIYDSIRKQPDTFCLSTLESCVRTLKLLEPDNPSMDEATTYLLSSLKALVKTQIEQERIHLEKNSIRNSAKFEAKRERQSSMFINPVDKGYSLRPLRQEDALYVDSRWPYRSNKSLKMIDKQIRADVVNATRTNNSVCLGVEYKNNLVGCILRHRNGSLGILHVDPEHRRNGLGELLLKGATNSVKSRGEPAFAYIVDGNKASEALFTSLGWEKADPHSKKGTG